MKSIGGDSTRYLAHHTFYPNNGANVLLHSTVQTGTVSPIHVIFMHGLLGCHRNFASVCSALAGADSLNRIKGDLADPLMRVKQISDRLNAQTPPLSSPYTVIPGPARAPRIYQSAAFDWRNHGDSYHTTDMSLDGLSEDITQFLQEYASTAASRGGTAELPSTTTARPLPIFLVAHSMGAMGLMHWMWKTHIKRWSHANVEGKELNVFRNRTYRVVGAAVVDMAPAPRPSTFANTRHLIAALPSIPIHTMHSRAEAEQWLLAHGPRDVCTQANIWLIRYQLSNLVFQKGSPPIWKVGLNEIIKGLDHIMWVDGGTTCVADINDSRQRWLSAGDTGRCVPFVVPKFAEFPTYFLFGSVSPYNTAVGHQKLLEYFDMPCVMEMEKANHFMFMTHKRSFVDTLRNILYSTEEQEGML